VKDQDVPIPVVKRLSLYLRELERLTGEGTSRVSSRQLAESLCLTAAQVRKDLACFGQFGRPGVGYLVDDLMDRVRRILGTDRQWNVVVVGVGGIGGALLKHRGFRKRGFRFVGAVDVAPEVIGRQVGPVVVNHIDALPQIVRERGVKLGIVTVPAGEAPRVAEALRRAGVEGILNFAPMSLPSLDGVAVEPVDIAGLLEHLCFEVGVAATTAAASSAAKGDEKPLDPRAISPRGTTKGPARPRAAWKPNRSSQSLPDRNGPSDAAPGL
jgi:redox-sensing transcriptional repressor